MKKKLAMIMAIVTVFSAVSALPAMAEENFISANTASAAVAEGSLIGVWEGNYEGISGDGSSVFRIIRLNITSQNGNTFSGDAMIDRSPTEMYLFSGSIDPETGEISFCGTDWISNHENYGFAEFKGSFTKESFISGCVDDDESRVLILTRHSDKPENRALDKAAIPTDWIGEYDGSSGATVVRRNYEFHIDTINDDGTVKGKAILSPSPKAEAEYGASGSYYFAGNIDFTTGVIHMQGNEWIDYPLGYDDFTFIELDGRIDTKDGTIKGASEEGIWDMSVIDYKTVKTQSKFELGKDNNSFVHSSNTDHFKYAGFAGHEDYSLSDEYYKKLTNGTTKGEKDRIDNYISDSWGGSCYGIAMTMGLVYEGRIDLSDIDSSGAENYYAMSFPSENDKLYNNITYYQLTQMLDRCADDKICIAATYRSGFFGHLVNWEAENDSLSVFLKKLVQSCNNDHVKVLSFNHKTSWFTSSGHAILVTGCHFDEAKDEYVIELYDENSVDDDQDLRKGEFSEMRIKKDYSDFSFDNVDDSSYRSMVLIDWDKLEDVILDQNPAPESNTTLSVRFSDMIKIENAEGEYIEYDGSELSGDMEVYGINESAADEDKGISTLNIKTDYSNHYTVTCSGKTVDLEIHNSDGFISLNGSNITTATLDLESGIDMYGKDIDFSAAFSNYSSSKRAANVIRFEGSSADNVSVKRDEDEKLHIESAKKVTGGTLTYISGQKNKTVKLDDTTEYDIDSDKSVWLQIGDINADGLINVTDISLASAHVKGVKAITDKDSIEASDANTDKRVDVADISMIAAHVKGIKALR